MKKLIAMIGAVAMSFGLFAASPAPFTISFEQAEQDKGVNTTSMLFTPVESDTEWAWTTEEALPLKAYGTETKFAYGTGAYARRDDKFAGMTDNANYLPLSTGSDELTRAVNGNLYLDQLVKFTGFEDPQTNLVAGTKIAVWMSEFENDDESTTTNLYVTVGKVTDDGVKQVALQIKGDYKLDTWYRLSIKSLGGIYTSAVSDSQRAGFLIYIDGRQAEAVDAEAKTLIPYDGEMDGIAKGYMAKGQLFTAIDATDATFNTVGYQGIGAVDDIILDDVGPAFCQAIDVVIPEVDGAVVDYIDVGGKRMQPPVSVPDGTTITVYFKPAPGKKITGGVTSVTQTISTGAATIIVSGIIAEDVVATLTPAVGTASDLAASELAGALEALGVGDKIAISAACQTDDYIFSTDTTITGTETGLSIFVGAAGDCALEVAANIAADKTLVVEFEDGDLGEVTFGGAVAGTLEVKNGLIYIKANIELAAGASIKAAAFDFDSYSATITLSEVGATVKALEDNMLIDSGYILAGADLEPQVSQEPDEDRYYTYTAVQAGVEKIELAFTSLPADTAVTAVTGNTVEGDAETGWKAVAGDTLTITLTALNGKVFNENGDTTTTVQAEASASIDLSAAPAPFAPAAKVAEIVGGDQYATLGEAIAALTGGETIKLLSNYTATTNEANDLTFNANATLDLGGYTLTVPGAVMSTQKFGTAAGTTVTFTNGVINMPEEGGNRGITICGTLNLACKVVRNGAHAPAFDVMNGATINAGDDAEVESDAIVFWVKKAGSRTWNITGGKYTTKLTSDDYTIFYFSYADCEETLNITAGEFNSPLAIIHDMQHNVVHCSLDDTCAAKFSNNTDLAQYIKAGYEAVKGEDNYYTIQAIPSYTVAAISVANASVVATNKTAGGATFALPADLLRDTEIAVTVTPNENYEYKTTPAGWTKNGDGSITTNATVTANLAITVEAPTAALQPVDPETPKSYDSKEAADAAADAINANKTAMIKTPDGADAADYTALFTAVVKANNEVVVELNEVGTNALKAAATTIETAVAGKLDDIAAATAGNSVSVTVTVGVKNGFWYGVAATADLTTMGSTQPTEWVQAKNGSVTIQATKPETGNAAFFQTRVKVK